MKFHVEHWYKYFEHATYGWLFLLEVMMKLVMWSFKNLSMPMVEDDSGELYCTSKAVCKSLDIKEDALRWGV